jgi:hypothetical protein
LGCVRAVRCHGHLQELDNCGGPSGNAVHFQTVNRPAYYIPLKNQILRSLVNVSNASDSRKPFRRAMLTGKELRQVQDAREAQDGYLRQDAQSRISGFSDGLLLIGQLWRTIGVRNRLNDHIDPTRSDKKDRCLTVALCNPFSPGYPVERLHRVRGCAKTIHEQHIGIWVRPWGAKHGNPDAFS